MTSFFFPVWIICKKDLHVWLLMRLLILATLLVPCSYLFVEYLAASAVGHNPIALVDLDTGTTGKELVQAIVDADVFRVMMVSSQEARLRYQNLEVAAIITIPAAFSRRLQQQEPDPLQVEVNNFNLDLTNDIRRAVPDAITYYYQHHTNPMTVHIEEHLLRTQNVQLFEYAVLPTILLLITVNGIITAGMTTAREWEQETIKELLMAPNARSAIIVGKVLAAFLTTSGLGTSMLLLGAFLGWTRPDDLFHGVSALLVILLGSLCASGIGIAVGAFFQRQQPVLFFATVIAIYLFALAGGVGVIFFEPVWLQGIAQFDPLTYAIHSLQMATFYASSEGFGRDVLVLVGTALGAIGLGYLALQREMAR